MSIKKDEGSRFKDIINCVFSLLTSWEVSAVGWSQAIEVNNNDLCKMKQILQVMMVGFLSPLVTPTNLGQISGFFDF